MFLLRNVPEWGIVIYATDQNIRQLERTDKLLRVLKDRQAVAEQQLAAARRGQAPPTRRRKWRVLEANLIRLKNAFRNGDRNLQEYWRAVSHPLWDL
ncbi:hypothetical protein ACOMHN_065524 [Nucella lapillus]